MRTIIESGRTSCPLPHWTQVLTARTVAVLPSGERAISIGAGTTGVYMRPVVGVVADQTVFVRDHRWRRYGMTEDGRTRLTGSGDAREP